MRACLHIRARVYLQLGVQRGGVGSLVDVGLWPGDGASEKLGDSARPGRAAHQQQQQSGGRTRAQPAPCVSAITHALYTVYS